jgi:hypothetical protein
LQVFFRRVGLQVQDAGKLLEFDEEYVAKRADGVSRIRIRIYRVMKAIAESAA